MNEEQRAAIERLRALCDSALSGSTPTYEDLVENVQEWMDTCPEP